MLDLGCGEILVMSLIIIHFMQMKAALPLSALTLSFVVRL